MRTISTQVSFAAIALVAVACSDAQSAAELNSGQPGGGDSTTESSDPGATESPAGGQQTAERDGAEAADRGANDYGQPSSEGGQQPVGLDAPQGDDATGTPADGAGDGSDPAEDPSSDPASAEDDQMGGPEDPPAIDDPFAPRSGSFRMLVYSRTTAFRHDSIAQGKAMLQEIANEQGFEITETEQNDLITPEGLAQFEIVFFMNSTGDIFNQAEELAFQDWMENRDGAFAGVHSATDTEQGWAFYKEVTGQYYDGHGNANAPGAIQFEAGMLDFPALRGIPNPWQRNEEWYNFNSFQQWSSQPGFQVLGRKAADNQPIMWVREWNNWRSFYSAIGHDSAVFRDPAVKRHLTGGIMWTVRRDHLLSN